jgi:hypothetical protein
MGKLTYMYVWQLAMEVLMPGAAGLFPYQLHHRVADSSC